MFLVKNKEMKYVKLFEEFINEGTNFNKNLVDDWKFDQGYGMITNINNKKVAILFYNSGKQKDLGVNDVINLGSLKNSTIDNSIVLHIQAYWQDNAKKVTKNDFMKGDIDMVIISDHNANNVKKFLNK